MGAKYLFVAANGLDVDDNNAAVGREMFVIDLSAMNPVPTLVKDIAPGAVDSYPIGFASIGEHVYFTAKDANTYEVYYYNADLNAPFFGGKVPNSGTEVIQLTAAGDKIYWMTEAVAAGTNLYATPAADSTAAKKIKDKDGDEVTPVYWRFGTAASDLVYNVITAPQTEPSVSDGTQNGTGAIAKIAHDPLMPPDNRFMESWQVCRITRDNQILFFRADSMDKEGQLYYSSAKIGVGAKILTAKEGVYTNSSNVTLFKGQVFFTASSEGKGNELWIVRKADNLRTEAIQPKDDAYAVLPLVPLEVSAAQGVLANDETLNPSPLTASLVTGPAHGTVTFYSDCSFRYVPAIGFVGMDTFTYAASDGIIVSDPVTVTIRVTIGPAANDDAYYIARKSSGTVIAPGLLINDVHPFGDELTVSWHGQPAHGTVAVNADGSFTYSPNSGYVGFDTFTYKVTDGITESDAVTVTIEVRNTAAIAASDAFQVAGNNTLTVAAPGVLSNDFDNQDDPLTAVLFSGTAHGTLTLNPDGSFSYTTYPGYTGTDVFTYRAFDGIDYSEPVEVTLTIVNEPPVANGDTYQVPIGGVLNVPAPGVLANDEDPEGDPMTAVLVSGPSHGTLVLNADGSFNYVTTPGYTGIDTFTYRVGGDARIGDPVMVTIETAFATEATTIGGLAWGDENGDGIRQGTEPVQANVPITLRDAAGNTIGNAFTGTDGNYVIEGVWTGYSYRLGVGVPLNQTLTVRDQGGDDTIDSDFDVATTLSAIFIVTPGSPQARFDAGLVVSAPLSATASVGGYVWLDADADGQMSPMEMITNPVAGLEVRLVDALTLITLFVTTTEANGHYSFNDIPPGSYYVEFIPLENHTFTTPFVGVVGTDSNVDPATHHSNALTLEPWEVDLTIGAGLLGQV